MTLSPENLKYKNKTANNFMSNYEIKDQMDNNSPIIEKKKNVKKNLLRYFNRTNPKQVKKFKINHT